MKKLLFLFLTVSIVVLSACSGTSTGAKKFTIAVVPKGTTHPFWKSMNAGAIKTAADYKA